MEEEMSIDLHSIWMKLDRLEKTVDHIVQTLVAIAVILGLILFVTVAFPADLYTTPCSHSTEPVEHSSCWVPATLDGWYLSEAWYSDLSSPQGTWWDHNYTATDWIYVWAAGDPDQIDVHWQGYETEKVATCYCHGDPPDPDIFSDGFESGDLSAWSQVVEG